MPDYAASIAIGSKSNEVQGNEVETSGCSLTVGIIVTFFRRDWRELRKILVRMAGLRVDG